MISRQAFLVEHSVTLNIEQLRQAADSRFTDFGAVRAREFGAADPDHDATLTLDEYLAVVEQRFNAANRDIDGALDAKELNTSAERALLRLLT